MVIIYNIWLGLLEKPTKIESFFFFFHIAYVQNLAVMGYNL